MVEQYPGRVVNRKYSPCKEFLFLCASFLLSLSLGFTFTFCRPSPVFFLSKRIHRVQDQTYFLLHRSHASCQWPPRVESSKSLPSFLKMNREDNFQGSRILTCVECYGNLRNKGTTGKCGGLSSRRHFRFNGFCFSFGF